MQKAFVPIPVIIIFALGITLVSSFLLLKISAPNKDLQTVDRRITKGFGDLFPKATPIAISLPTTAPGPKPSVVTKTVVVTKSPSPSPLPSPNVSSCPNYSDAQALREFIFCSFGFRSEIAQRIRSSTTIEVENMNSTNGGGFWYGDSRKIFLYTAQREAALHELSHAFWQDERGDENRRLNLVKDLIKLASLDKNANSEYVNAINFANGYLYGVNGWKGDFCSPDGASCVEKDPKTLSDGEIIDYSNRGVINDHEIYAGFSSWTMGRLRNGPHKLPDFMANNFDEEFTGTISEVPYFEGGPK